MRAMQLVELGQPMALRDVEKPQPKAGEVLVKVHTCGLNFGDTLVIKGSYQEKPALPATIGMEICGTIEAVGAEVTGLSLGQKVGAYMGFGGLAEYAAVPAISCVPVPADMDPVDVAAFLVAYGTGHIAFEKAHLRPGERLLVLGASGGVGLTAVELGKVMGAEVIACARGAEKLALCKAAGADHLIDSETQDIRAVVKALGGADVVYDPIGGDQFKAALKATNPGARVLPIGFASGDVPQIPANYLLVKNITVIGFYIGAYKTLDPKVLTDSFSTLVDWYSAGKIKPHVSAVHALEDANEALDALRRRKATGKIVVQISAV